MPSSFEASLGEKRWSMETWSLGFRWIVTSLAALACARHADPPPPTPASQPPAATAEHVAPVAADTAASASAPAPLASSNPALAAHLKLGTLALKNENGQSVLLDANGELSVSGKTAPVGKLLPDGRFLAPDGSLKLRMNEKGEFFAADGQRMPVSVSDDGAVHVANGKQTLRFDANGTLVGGNANAPKTTVEGLTDETRRTAAFLLVLAVFPSRH